MTDDPSRNAAAQWAGHAVPPTTYWAVQRMAQALRTPATEEARRRVVEQSRRIVESFVATPRVEGLLSETTIAHVNAIVERAVFDTAQMQRTSDRTREVVERLLAQHGERSVQRLAEIATHDLSATFGHVDLDAETMESLVKAADLEAGRAAHAALAEDAPQLAAAIDKSAMTSDLREFLSPQEVQWFLAAMVFTLIVWWYFFLGQSAPGPDEPHVLRDLTEGSARGFAVATGTKIALGKAAGKKPPSEQTQGPDDAEAGA